MTAQEQQTSLLEECRAFVRSDDPRHELINDPFNDPQFDRSPHQYFFKNLDVLRCLVQASNGKTVVGFQVYTTYGTRALEAEANLVTDGRVKSRVGWVEDVG